MAVNHVMSDSGPERVSYLPEKEHGARLALAHRVAGGRRGLAHVTGPERFRVAGQRTRGWLAELVPHGPGTMFGRWSAAWGHEAVALGLRPKDHAAAPPDGAMISGRVEIVERLGEVTLVHLSAGKMGRVIAKLPGDMAPVRGDRLGLTARREKLHVFGPDERALARRTPGP